MSSFWSLPTLQPRSGSRFWGTVAPNGAVLSLCLCTCENGAKKRSAGSRKPEYLVVDLQKCQFVHQNFHSKCPEFVQGLIPVTNHHLLVFCLTTGPKPPPKRCLHIARCRTSSFKWEYPLLSLRSSSSFLRLLPRLLATSISPFIFPSITCFRRQFLRKMWPIQLAFGFLISCRVFLCSLTLSNTSSFSD